MLTTDRRGAELRPVVVINIARLGALPDSYPATIEHFSYLKPDYICLYDDLGVRGAVSADGTSGIFELTGYAPVLPLVLREKGMIWRYRDVKRGYASREPRRAETTSLLRQVAGSTLETVGAGMSAADRSIARLTVRARRESQAHDSSAGGYANAMMTAVGAAHGHARGVVVAVSPAETAEQIGNLRTLEMRMDGTIGSAPWIQFVDLGARTELHGNALRLDGWNYGGAGIALVAEQLAPALLSLIAQR